MSVKSLGILLDGNRRYSKANGLTLLEGYLKGAQKSMEMANWFEQYYYRDNSADQHHLTSDTKDEKKSTCTQAAMLKLTPELTMFVMSLANFSRPKEEVNKVLEVLNRVFSPGGQFLEICLNNGYKLNFIGHQWQQKFKEFSKGDELVDCLQKAEELTKSGTRMKIAVAVNYDGKQEIIDMFQELMSTQSSINVAPSVEALNKVTYLAKIGMNPSIDLIIRTGGANRMSEFMNWSCAKRTEWRFVNAMLPDLSKEQFDKILLDYDYRVLTTEDRKD